MFHPFLKKQFKYLLPLLLCVSFSALAQNAPVSYKILGITVEGNKTADAATIISSSGLKIGDEIQLQADQNIMNGIKQLWSLNLFSDINIYIDKQLVDGVFLLIKVKEFPRFEKNVFIGNDAESNSDLQAKIDLQRGQILKPQEVNKIKNDILKLYEKDGYLNAEINFLNFIYTTADTTKNDIEVKWRNEKDSSDVYTVKYDVNENSYINLIDKIKDRILLVVKINENQKVKVRHIVFQGNKAFDEGKLKGALDNTSEAKWWKFWSSAEFDPQKFEDDKKLLTTFYQRNGYRDAQVVSDSLIYSNNNKDLTVLINVYEGNQYFLRNITWEGSTVFPDKYLNERLGFKKGDVYDYEKFGQNLHGNKDQSDVAALYLDMGYLMFNIKQTEVKAGSDSMDVNIHIDEHNQFRIGKVTIAGNDKTKEKVIRRELYTIPGEFFNRALLLRSIQQLANLKYFNTEKLYGADGINTSLKNDSTVNVTFNVEEKSSDYLNASVGYSGSYGFSGSMGITLSNFALDHPFSLGCGQILSFSWQFGVSNIYRTFTLGFTEPWFMDSPTMVGFEIFDTRQQYYYDMSQAGASVKVGRRLRWPDDYFYIQGMFRYQYNDILDGAGVYPDGISHQYTVGATISRKNIDNPVFPSTGSSISLDAQLSGSVLLPGDLNYYKISFLSEWYKQLFNTNRLTWYTAAELDYIHELDQYTTNHINPFERFFMGGNGLVIATVPLRGYDDRSIGPTRGGDVAIRYTTELRVAVTLEPVPLYLLTFAEAGNVYLDLQHADPFHLMRSAGVGARIMINPIGLIGFDLGWGFDRKEVNGNNPAWLFHFQFGKGF
ncbi:MAG: outer membrane protein assembly factor BamA [Ignavibacteriaceae bacterium]|nr:outer membrane protein assembly factor BamA [Ignavibacteriaceae bacterium]